MPDGETGRRVVVAIMAKAPIPGEAKTRLIPALGAERAARLQRAMLLDTIDLVREAVGAEVTMSIICPSELHLQMLRAIVPSDIEIIAHGSPDLMKGLDYALTHYLQVGYERVILLDGDSPTLPASSLIAAIERLDEHDIVLGPTLDGGYYLLGAVRPHPLLFQWEEVGDAVCEQTRLRAEAAGMDVLLLPPWFDVDTAGDYERLLGDLQSDRGGALHVRSLLLMEASA